MSVCVCVDMFPALFLTVFHDSSVCELSQREKSREATTCPPPPPPPSDFFSPFHLFVLMEGPDLLQGCARLIFYLDTIWILSVEVEFCTPVRCFEGVIFV